MNAKLCKRIRQFLRLTDVPHSRGTMQTSRGNRHPAGTFEYENTRLKRFARSCTAAQRHTAFPPLNFPVR